jgi:7-cyano-7-deazaguanine synthase in queuosine biosynthesis
MVFWSGGADSTLALTMYASLSSVQTPVRALTVVGHPQLNQQQLKNEKRAREAYLRWAKKRGFNIQHETVKIETAIDVKVGDQTVLWLCHLSPYIWPDETVVFSYIQGDVFWHRKHEFEVAFNMLAELSGAKRSLLFPLEWDRKWSVLSALKKWKVPDNCWWSCDVPSKNKPCGKCLKCRELKAAREELVERGRAEKIAARKK